MHICPRRVCMLMYFIPSVSQVPKDIPMTYRMQLKQILAVKNLKPAVVEVYDYYQPSMHSLTLFLAKFRNASKLIFPFFQVMRLRPRTCPHVHDCVSGLALGCMKEIKDKYQ